MENRKSLVFLVLLLLLWCKNVYAYDAVLAHPFLTEEIISCYENKNQAIEEREKKQIVFGSQSEDDGFRPLKHFYDPINEKGLPGHPTSRQWAQSSALQSAYTNLAIAVGQATVLNKYTSSHDFAWERAIYDYVYVDENRGLEGLGHILHLLQDKTVPEHVRNDTHLPYFNEYINEQSPYEKFTASNDYHQEICSVLEKAKYTPIKYKSIDTYFKKIANFTNNNFLSKDTVIDSTYIKPNFSGAIEVGVNNKNYLALELDGTSYILVGFEDTLDENNIFKRDYFLTRANDDTVIRSYWSILSKEVVKNGVGVMELFFKEVEIERMSGTLKLKNQNKIVMFGTNTATAVIPHANALMSEMGGFLIDNAITTKNVAVTTYHYSVSAMSELFSNISNFIFEDDSQQNNQSASLINLSNLSLNSTQTETTSSPQNPNDGTTINQPAFSINEIVGLIQEAQMSLAILQSDIENLSGGINQSEGASNTGLGGNDGFSQISNINLGTFIAGVGAPAVVVIEESSEQTEDIDETDEGETNEDESGEENNEPDADEELQTILPININCTPTVSSDCVLPSPMSVFLSWELATETPHYYSCEGILCEFATSTATSTTVAGTAAGENILVITAHLLSGDIFAQGTSTINVLERSVILSEIAWQGTDAESHDEWIELYNMSEHEIDLSDWTIESADGNPTFALGGSVSAKNYALLERKEEAVTSAMSTALYGNFGASFAMSNSGEHLFLKYKNILIDEIDASDGWWYGAPMERVCYGENKTKCEWKYYYSFIDRRDSTDREGNIINGTPGAPNTHDYFLNAMHSIDDRIEIKSGETVFACNNNYKIESGGVLVIEAGGMLKICDGVNFEIYGTLIMEGEKDNLSIITRADDLSVGEIPHDEYSQDEIWPFEVFEGGKFEATNAKIFGFSEFAYTYGGDIDIVDSEMFVTGNLITSYNDSDISIQNTNWTGCNLGCTGILAYDNSKIILNNLNVSAGDTYTLLLSFDDAVSEIKNFSSIDPMTVALIMENSSLFADNINIENAENDAGCVLCLYANSTSTILNSIFKSMGEDGHVLILGGDHYFENTNILGGQYAMQVISSNPANPISLKMNSGTISGGTMSGLLFVGNQVSADLNGINIKENNNGIENYESSAVVNNSNIFDNTVHGIYKINGSVLAVNNWWGDQSGPYESINNPEGMGDMIFGVDEYTPWSMTKFGD